MSGVEGTGPPPLSAKPSQSTRLIKFGELYSSAYTTTVLLSLLITSLADILGQLVRVVHWLKIVIILIAVLLIVILLFTQIIYRKAPANKRDVYLNWRNLSFKTVIHYFAACLPAVVLLYLSPTPAQECESVHSSTCSIILTEISKVRSELDVISTNAEQAAQQSKRAAQYADAERLLRDIGEVLMVKDGTEEFVVSLEANSSHKLHMRSVNGFSLTNFECRPIIPKAIEKQIKVSGGESCRDFVVSISDKPLPYGGELNLINIPIEVLNKKKKVTTFPFFFAVDNSPPANLREIRSTLLPSERWNTRNRLTLFGWRVPGASCKWSFEHLLHASGELACARFCGRSVKLTPSFPRMQSG